MTQQQITHGSYFVEPKLPISTISLISYFTMSSMYSVKHSLKISCVFNKLPIYKFSHHDQLFRMFAPQQILCILMKRQKSDFKYSGALINTPPSCKLPRC